MLAWIAMFGGQHMELAALTTSDDLAERSGWTGALVQAGAANLGKRTLFWKHDHTSPEVDVRTRWQLVSWHQVLEKAHQENVKSSESNTESMRLKDIGAPFSRKRSSSVSLSCGCCSPYSCLFDISGLATSRCTSSHCRSIYTGFSLLAITTMYDGHQFISWYDDSVSFASPHICRTPEGTLHRQEEEVFKLGHRSSTWET